MFENVKQEIDDKIKTNGNNEITATRLNGVLQDMMDASAEEIGNVAESVGTKVEANPTGAATDSLEKIKIGDTTYKTDNPFVGEVEATDAQRLQALANISNQEAGYDDSNPPEFTGKMGYKVLDPTKTFAEQVTAENTIYEIRDVFDLGGTQETPVSVTLPAGSTLKFNGGVIKNCTLVNAYVDAAREKIFDTSVNFTNLKNGVVYPEWWGAVADGITDNSAAFEKAASISKTISIGRGTYLINNEISCSAYTSIIGENKSASVIKTNGIKLREYSVVNNVTIRSISKNTPYLIKISNSITGYNQYILNINIDNVDLVGANFNEFDTQVYGLVLECEENSNNVGFYGVNITNVFFKDRMLYGIYFNAVDANAWIAFVNFVNVFINNAKYPIEFDSVLLGTSTNFYNFQNIYFKNVSAQYNANNTVSPSLQWTESFARITHLSRGVFDSCCIIDSPTSIKPYYFKSVYASISVVNEGEDIVPNLFGRYDDASNDVIYADNICGTPTTLYTKDWQFLKALFVESTTNNSTTPASASIIGPVCDVTGGFIGFQETGNERTYSTKENFRFGICREGYMVHSGNVGPGGTFKYKRVYSTGYVPVFGSTLPVPNDLGGLGRGAFIWSSTLYHLLCYDTYTGKWYDTLGVPMVGGLKRRGDSATRIAWNVRPSWGIDGFIYYDTDLKKWVLWNGNAWVNIDGSTLAHTKGADTDRPTLTSDDAGFQYFDTTLSKYICWNGTAWVNLDGTALS